MFEKNKEKMKEKMEPDKVLRFAIVAVILLFLIGALIIGTRMMNPRVDATEGVKKLTELGDANVQKIDAKIQEFLVWQRLTEVGFVEQKQSWLAGFERFFGDELVVVVWIFAAIECEQDKVGAFDGVIDLILDVSFKFVIWIFETSSVNEKVTIVDFGDDIIARSTRFARNNSLLTTSEAIEEAGLAGISLADDCYYG